MKTKLKFVGVSLGGLIVAYYLAFGVFFWAGYRMYRFPTMSMQPTIQKGERVFGQLSESYRDHISRFDIVIYVEPRGSGEIYAKRVVGLPGERIAIDQQGVTIGGRQLPLPPAIVRGGLGKKACDLTIPSDAVFVLGDNTPNSNDSRFLGPIRKRDILGHLIFKK